MYDRPRRRHTRSQPTNDHLSPDRIPHDLRQPFQRRRENVGRIFARCKNGQVGTDKCQRLHISPPYVLGIIGNSDKVRTARVSRSAEPVRKDRA